MEIRQLQYFVAVAQTRHFGRAAERLHMAQSPLSQAIRQLESQVGATLFDRTTRRVELTPAGEACPATPSASSSRSRPGRRGCAWWGPAAPGWSGGGRPG